MTEMTDNIGPKRDHPFKKRLPILVILAVALFGLFFLRDFLSFDTLAEHRESLIAFRDANYGLTAMVFMMGYAAMVAFSLPGATVATLTGGFLFATFPGALFNVVGATVGAIAIFQAARWGFGDKLGARLEASEGRIKRIKDGIDENQWSMLFMLRLIPVVPFFVANLLPSLLEVPLRRFAVSTFFGIMPGAIVYTSIGAGLGEVFERGERPDLAVLTEPYVLWPLLGLIALSALPVVLKAFRKKDVA